MAAYTQRTSIIQQTLMTLTEATVSTLTLTESVTGSTHSEDSTHHSHLNSLNMVPPVAADRSSLQGRRGPPGCPSAAPSPAPSAGSWPPRRLCRLPLPYIRLRSPSCPSWPVCTGASSRSAATPDSWLRKRAGPPCSVKSTSLPARILTQHGPARFEEFGPHLSPSRVPTGATVDLSARCPTSNPDKLCSRGLA